ncbi:2059_t:CDS:2 [Acaulospora colombiana]|uniref:2059_t:CDS:1 n=1 Tax=Acaulospora colombiana TaxID=27376 RepID=A0ACA9LT71_9GLOM|nr:2059_t:CDS:2 [Acaulospora colombiana]
MSSSEGEIVTQRQTVKIKPRTVQIKPRRAVSGETLVTSVSLSKHVSDNADLQGSSNESKNMSKTYDDDDSFFTRNSNFSRKIITKTEKSVEILKELEDNTHGNDNSQFNDESSAKRARKSKGKSKQHDWIFSGDPINLSDFSDHEDLSDFSDEIDERENNKGKKHDIPDLEREPSLTPPPELNEYQLRSTIIILKTGESNSATLMQYSERLRSDGSEIGSPVVPYETQDDTELDPDLLAIRQSIKQNNERSSQSINAKVEIKVTPIRHPEIEINDTNRKTIADYEKPIKFIIKTSDNFEQMIKWLCDKKGIWKQDLILTYKKVKVFPRSTPESLGMVGQVVMEAYTKDTFNYIKEREALSKKRLLDELDRDSELSEENGINDNSDASDINYVNEDDYIHLKLRSEDESVEKLKVKKVQKSSHCYVTLIFISQKRLISCSACRKQSLTVQSVIGRYKKMKNIPESENVRLLLEDEALSFTDKLGDTDLEDGDMLSVVLN